MDGRGELGTTKKKPANWAMFNFEQLSPSSSKQGLLALIFFLGGMEVVSDKDVSKLHGPRMSLSFYINNRELQPRVGCSFSENGFQEPRPTGLLPYSSYLNLTLI